MNTEKHLDERIKQALENLQATNDGRAWEAFEQRLDQDAPNGIPSFDEVISGKLTSLEVLVTTGDWSRMEKMIEAEETAEQLENEAVVDNLVLEKLDRFEVAFQPHHWQMMAHRLEEEFFIRYHLLRCKAAEVGLMLLLLLTMVRFTPVLDGKLDGTMPGSNPFPPALKSSPSEKNKPAAAPAIAGSSTLQAAQPIAGLHSTTPLAKTSIKTPGKIRSSSLQASNSAVVPAENKIASTSTTAFNLPALALSTVHSLDEPANLFEEIKASNLRKNNLRTPGMDEETLRNAAMITSLDPQPVQSKFAWEVPQLPQQIFQKGRKLRFSIFTTTDVAYVFSPSNKYSVFDTLIATGQDTTLASGYGGGITASWKKDKWEIQTGGIYSFKRYVPNSQVFLFETVNYIIREEFNGVQLDMLQVPLNFNYHFKNQGKWRVYSSLGASGHFITSSVYDIASSRTPSFSNYGMLPRPTGLPEDDKSVREEKEFPDGLFDGGSIHDNFYLTANVGLGMERFLSPRWSLFFQPNYQHYIITDGIGVNGEKLYNFSFYLGTKVNLK